MTERERQDRAGFVRDMFDRISPRYDFLNRLMTLGQDAKWRSDVIRMLPAAAETWVLDLGTGTGDLAYELAKEAPDLKVLGLDFSREMIRVGRRRKHADAVQWVIADASRLPFKKAALSAIIYAFVLRNIVDLPLALGEQFRTLRPGGRVVCLETTPPRADWLNPLVSFYLDVIVPLLGKLFAGDLAAYQYLRDSTRVFLNADELAIRFQKAGFEPVEVQFRMLQTIAIHAAGKPPLWAG